MLEPRHRHVIECRLIQDTRIHTAVHVVVSTGTLCSHFSAPQVKVNDAPYDAIENPSVETGVEDVSSSIWLARSDASRSTSL